MKMKRYLPLLSATLLLGSCGGGNGNFPSGDPIKEEDATVHLKKATEELKNVDAFGFKTSLNFEYKTSTVVTGADSAVLNQTDINIKAKGDIKFGATNLKAEKAKDVKASLTSSGSLDLNAKSQGESSADISKKGDLNIGAYLDQGTFYVDYTSIKDIYGALSPSVDGGTEAKTKIKASFFTEKDQNPIASYLSQIDVDATLASFKKENNLAINALKTKNGYALTTNLDNTTSGKAQDGDTTYNTKETVVGKCYLSFNDTSLLGLGIDLNLTTEEERTMTYGDKTYNTKVTGEAKIFFDLTFLYGKDVTVEAVPQPETFVDVE